MECGITAALRHNLTVAIADDDGVQAEVAVRQGTFERSAYPSGIPSGMASLRGSSMWGEMRKGRSERDEREVASWETIAKTSISFFLQFGRSKIEALRKILKLDFRFLLW